MSRAISLAGSLCLVQLCIAHCPKAVLCATDNRTGIFAAEAIIDLPLKASPFVFPEKIVSGPNRQLYVLDTGLSKIFSIGTPSGRIEELRMSKVKNLHFTDICIDSQGAIWSLNSIEDTVQSFSSKGEAGLSFRCRSSGLNIGVLSDGNIVIRTVSGPGLFNLYGRDGNFLRSVGERKRGSSPVEESWLNDGCMSVVGRHIFYCFSYPYEVVCYDESGTRVWRRLISRNLPHPEFKPSGDKMQVSIAPSALSIAAFDTGEVCVLFSGAPRIEALSRGTDKLDVISRRGLLASYRLQHHYNCIAVSRDRLLAMTNRNFLRADAYLVSRSQHKS